MKCLITLLGIGTLVLASVSCGETKKPPEPPVIVEAPSYDSLAEGWKIQSYALIGIAVIVAIVVIGKSKPD